MAIHEIQGFEVPFLPSGRQFANTWTDFEPDKRVVLPRGWKREGRRPLPEAIVWLKDVAVELRDGVKIRADIFRPASRENERLPAIIPWSPYGKTGTGIFFSHDYPYLVAPASNTSGLENFEGPAPSEWCPRGYAVVQADVRGTFNSEGDQYFFGTGEG
ncbi:hypothetical protein LTS14_001826 [Recurvomyces mirabilis]|uniref:uncharacterized protein n=1 Tax=Recurvomyces mirabilis TaxID=574656 RepID=UPI002DE185A8|nr:hypothetical protein LTS14_001826 [Recurvomyces mirabilis]